MGLEVGKVDSGLDLDELLDRVVVLRVERRVGEERWSGSVASQEMWRETEGGTRGREGKRKGEKDDEQSAGRRSE